MGSVAARDYVGIATKYAEAAVADKGRKRHGRWIRLAAKRFLDDLNAVLLRRVARE